MEKESKEEDSLLNAVRELMKIRNEEVSLREGSLEIINGVPAGILGYTRIFGAEKATVFLNFGQQPKQFKIHNSECIFKLSQNDNISNNTLHLSEFSGIILKTI